MQRLLQERDALSVVSDEVGAPTWAASIARATAEIVRKRQAGEGGPGGLYHLTASGETSWYGFACSIAEQLRQQGRLKARIEPIPSRDYPTAAARPLTCGSVAPGCSTTGASACRIGKARCMNAWRDRTRNPPTPSWPRPRRSAADSATRRRLPDEPPHPRLVVVHTSTMNRSTIRVHNAPDPQAPTHDRTAYSPSPRWRNLALLALLLAPLLWPLQQLAERYYRNELTEQNRQTLDLYVANLLGTLSRYEVLPRILGDLPALRAALQHAEEPYVRDSANRLLKKLRKQTGADVIYLMATDGNTLAASNWDEEDSFVDRNFAFRPYFRQAMEGRLGRFFGLGTTSGKRGYYFGAAVRDGDQVLGVLVVKVDLDHTETLWAAPRSSCW